MTPQTPLRPGGATPAGGGTPMTPGQAAWVRNHAWTDPMRREYGHTPGHYTHCTCQYGPTRWCAADQHHRCGRAEPLPWHEALACGVGGVMPVYFTAPYDHPTPSATGAHREWVAMVWLADRTCRWQCPCDCHTAPAAPEQLDLFAGVAS